MALPTKNRLKNKKDFDVVFKKGKSINGSFLFIKSIPSSRGYPRFGFMVAAKFAPKAVIRNKIRRLLADVIWPKRLPNMPACDTVVVATKKIPADISLVGDDFVSVLRQARFIWIPFSPVFVFIVAWRLGSAGPKCLVSYIRRVSSILPAPSMPSSLSANTELPGVLSRLLAESPGVIHSLQEALTIHNELYIRIF